MINGKNGPQVGKITKQNKMLAINKHESVI